MQLAILQGFEMGTYMLPFAFESPLCWIFWGCLLFGLGIQAVLQRRKNLRFAWVILLAAALVGCETACQVITGWDLVLWVALYFYLLTMLVGALIGMLIRYIRQRK